MPDPSDKFISEDENDFVLVKKGSGTSAIAGPNKLGSGDGSLPEPDNS